VGKQKGKQIETLTLSSSLGVCISWSGDASRLVAEALGKWIPNIFQDVDTFVSSNDIDAGSNWFGKIQDELARTRFGIVCLTPDNLSRQWIHFEAGAIAKQVAEKTRMIPYLHHVNKTDLTLPLSLYQAVNADKNGTLALIKSLNTVRPQPFDESRVETLFEKWWGDLENTLGNIKSIVSEKKVQRTDRDILEEILTILRNTPKSDTSRRIRERISFFRDQFANDSKSKVERFIQLLHAMEHEQDAIAKSALKDELKSLQNALEPNDIVHNWIVQALKKR
jgi:hypothetical protein